MSHLTGTTENFLRYPFLFANRARAAGVGADVDIREYRRLLGLVMGIRYVFI